MMTFRENGDARHGFKGGQLIVQQREMHIFLLTHIGHPSFKNIRLIELNASQSLGLRIRISSLREGHVEQYEALSCCWGDSSYSYATNSSNVLILWVSKTIHQALLWLKPEEGVRLLWADAILIY